MIISKHNSLCVNNYLEIILGYIRGYCHVFLEAGLCLKEVCFIFSGLRGGDIAGIIIGTILGVALLSALAVVLVRGGYLLRTPCLSAGAEEGESTYILNALYDESNPLDDGMVPPTEESPPEPVDRGISDC